MDGGSRLRSTREFVSFFSAKSIAIPNIPFETNAGPGSRRKLGRMTGDQSQVEERRALEIE